MPISILSYERMYMTTKGEHTRICRHLDLRCDRASGHIVIDREGDIIETAVKMPFTLMDELPSVTAMTAMK
jgi:hypothetical protein